MIDATIQDKLTGIGQTAKDDPELAADELLKVEISQKASISSFKKKYELIKPAGLGLTKNQQENWNAYLREYEELEKKVFAPLEKKLRDLVSATMHALPTNVDQRRRVDLALRGLRKQTEKQAQKAKKEANDEVQELTKRVLAEMQDRMTALHNVYEKTNATFEREGFEKITDAGVEQLLLQFESDFKVDAEKEIRALENVRDQLGMLSDAIANKESITDVTMALEEQTESFRGQVEMYAEMAQIGTAVGIVQHEFASAFSMMENYIKQLRGWSGASPQLKEIYKHIRLNFEHLDEYMKAFAPFNKRMHRRKIEISGQELRYYLENLFEDRLARHHVHLKGTRAFDNYRLMAYPSTIYPCFMNLVDNSIYWLTKDVDGMARVDKGKREIKLDADVNGMFITDTGPGVESRIADRIFEFAYTKKKSGRGMGLYVSREILRRDGFDLLLTKRGKGVAPIFQVVSGDGNHGEDAHV